MLISKPMHSAILNEIYMRAAVSSMYIVSVCFTDIVAEGCVNNGGIVSRSYISTFYVKVAILLTCDKRDTYNICING